jgi:hypothetical protein
LFSKDRNSCSSFWLQWPCIDCNQNENPEDTDENYLGGDDDAIVETFSGLNDFENIGNALEAKKVRENNPNSYYSCSSIYVRYLTA